MSVLRSTQVSVSRPRGSALRYGSTRSSSITSPRPNAVVTPWRERRGSLLDERPFAQLLDRALELGARVHHDGPVPPDGLLDGRARHEEEPDALVAGADDNLVAAVEQHEGAVARVLVADRGAALDLLREHASRLGGVAERARSCEDVRERVVRGIDGQPPRTVWRHRHVEVARLCRHAFDRALLAP